MPAPRTSASHPILVDWIAPGLGCTFAPGKSATSAFGGSWQRDLGADLDRLRDTYGVDVLISLVEDHELTFLGIPGLVAEAGPRGIRVVRAPIPDGGTPAPQVAEELVRGIQRARRAGGTVVIHCRGGLGRAGTLAACVLRSEGVPAPTAIARVRSARPGSIENAAQEAFVAAFVVAA